jgi:DNA polymerase-3 subunit beta
MQGSFTTPAGALVSAVKYVAKWLDTRPANPVLGGLVFDVADGVLTIAGQSDLATARTVLDVAGDAKGRFIVAGRLVDALTSTLTDKPITFEQDGSVVSMKAGRYVATLPAMSENDYPGLAELAPTAGRIDGAALVSAARRAAIAASKNDESRIVMTGIHFSFDDDPSMGADGDPLAYTVTLTATDSLRVNRQTVEWSPDSENAPIGESFVIPASVMADAGEVFAGVEPVEIGWRESVVSLSTSSRSLITTTLGGPGQYPDLSSLFSQFDKRTHTATIKVKDLMVPLKRADQLADSEYKHIQLEMSPGLINLRSATEGKGGGGEEIDVEYDGPGHTITMRSGILHGLLSSVPGDTVVLHLTPGAYLSVFATSPAEPDWMHLFMPIRHT